MKKLSSDFVSSIRQNGGAFLLKDPSTRNILFMVEDATKEVGGEASVLNIAASKDKSGERESIYRDLFSKAGSYESIDFWEDSYVYKGQILGTSSKLPFGSETFDVVLTTKIIMEHVTEPKDTLRDIVRVLRPGGSAYLIFSFFRGIHQRPHDYFRFTEYAIRHLCKEVGVQVEYIRPTTSDFISTVDLSVQYPLVGVFLRVRMIAVSLLRKFWLPLMYALDSYMFDAKKYPRHYICKIKKTIQ